MSAPDFYGSVLYVVQYRRDPKYKFEDYGTGITDRETALADIRRIRVSAAAKGREYRLICRATSITEIEIPVQ